MAGNKGVFAPLPYAWTKYKITQATTAAPAIGGTVFNLIAGLQSAPTLARTGAGVYTITTAGTVAAFTAGKTFAQVTPSGAAARIVHVVYTSTSVITLNVFDAATPSAADSGDFDLEIQVYD